MKTIDDLRKKLTEEIIKSAKEKAEKILGEITVSGDIAVSTPVLGTKKKYKHQCLTCDRIIFDKCPKCDCGEKDKK